MRRQVVSDHAVIRYLERAKGIEMDVIRTQIAMICQTGLETGACGVIADGLEFRIEGGVVVTVQIPSHPDHRTGRVRRRRETDR